MVSETMPISVIVLTHNEESNIESCLRSVVPWSGEVFIVDSGSTDRTLEIAAKYTDKIFSHPFENYSRQRNWAQVSLPLRFNWVFHIDADERVSSALRSKLQVFFRKNISNQSVAGILVRRRIEFLGRHIKHGGIYPTYHCRIFKRELGRCEDREYDQHFFVDGPTVRIEGDLVESTASSLSSWTAKHNRWAEMEARHLVKNSTCAKRGLVEPKLAGSPIERRRWLRFYYEKSPLFVRALLYFCARYFLKGGFLDGIPGLIYHVLHGFWFRFYVDACYYEIKHTQHGR